MKMVRIDTEVYKPISKEYYNSKAWKIYCKMYKTRISKYIILIEQSHKNASKSKLVFKLGVY